MANKDIIRNFIICSVNSKGSTEIIVKRLRQLRSVIRAGVYISGRPFVRLTLLEAGRTRLNLFFIEVARGGGQGPGELWLIGYKPAITTTADKAAVVVHIHENFGPSTKVFNKQIECWANKNYVQPQYFDRAYTAVLNLTTYSSEFNSQRTRQY